jgi:hypothetical protein
VSKIKPNTAKPKRKSAQKKPPARAAAASAKRARSRTGVSPVRIESHGQDARATTAVTASAPVAARKDDLAIKVPHIPSFRHFLQHHARVPGGRGEYCQYSFQGREPLIEIVDTIDEVLGSKTGQILPDATIAICGGAQFGKSATELNLGAYCTGVAWLNWGFYLPDRDLVEGMVDTKFRPDILDQIDWFARMTQVGKTVNKSGKSVNRKGAFSVTNGKQRSHGMILGLNKIPTSYTFDVTTLDEVDDIKPAREKFVRGRMTSSSVRLLVKIGTQRIAGRGQHKAWKDGSQGVMLHKCPNPECGHKQNLEENWPRICRLRIDPPISSEESENTEAPPGLGPPASRRPVEVGTSRLDVPACESAGGTTALANEQYVAQASRLRVHGTSSPRVPTGAEASPELSHKIEMLNQSPSAFEVQCSMFDVPQFTENAEFTAPQLETQNSKPETHPPSPPDPRPSPPDPYLTPTGDFRHHDTGPTIAVHTPTNEYYFACIRCGAELNRGAGGFEWKHRREERRQQRHWSFRISQFAISAIDISQIVAEWVRAVADPEAMATFLCDRKAMPESTAQKLTVEILERSRSGTGILPVRIKIHDQVECLRKIETQDRLPPLPKERLGVRGNEASTCPNVITASATSKLETPNSKPETASHAFAGLDTGRRCWFFARAVDAPDEKTVLHVEQIPLGNLVDRVTELFHALGLHALFIDQAPATDEARTLALRLNGLETLQHWPTPPKDKSGYISLPGGLRWNGTSQRWENLRCAVVAFTKRRLGAGISHGFDIFEKGSQTMFVPLIETNRFETIDRVVREFLTPSENVSEVIFAPGGQSYIRAAPAMRLPPKGPGAPIIHETLDEHHLAGSERVELRDGTLGDYVAACENHFLLANAYSGLAEQETGARHHPEPAPIRVFENTRRSQIISSRSTRQVDG